MVPTKMTINCSFCTANDWFAFGSRLLTCVKESEKPMSSSNLYNFTYSDPELPKKLAQFWTLSNGFLEGRSRNGLRLAAVFCYISHHLYHTNIEKPYMEVLTGIIYFEKWELEPLVIPYRKYKEAIYLIAHRVVDVELFSEHFSTWNFVFQNRHIETAHALLHGMRNSEKKQRLLVDSLKLKLSTNRVRRMVIEWGLDVRGLDIFPVVKKLGDGKWHMQTLLLCAPLVAQFVAFGSRCDIFHPCSPLIIRACRVGIIANLLWRYQTSCNICLPKAVIVNILQFVSYPRVMHAGKSKSASKIRDGDNMIKNVIKMLGETSEAIYEAAIDCTPCPTGHSQVKKMEARDEYGSNSKFIPLEEKKTSTTTNYKSLHKNVWRKSKWSKQSTKTSEVYDFKKDIPSSIKLRISKNFPNRVGYRGRPQLNPLDHDHDMENVNCKVAICSVYKEENHPQRQVRTNHQTQRNVVNSKQMSRRSFGVKDRNVGLKYNRDTSPKRSRLQVDEGDKIHWTQKRSKSSTNSLTPSWKNHSKSRYPSSPNLALQNFHLWTPERFERLQERVCRRVKLKNLPTNP